MRQSFSFGPFVLDTNAGTLFNEGSAIPLSYRAAQLLAVFLSRPGEVLTKSDLIDAVWNGAAVEESNLTVQMAALRKALGSRLDGNDWIATVPRIGYRFTGAVDASDGPLPVAEPGERPDRPLVAVLPFANLSDDRSQDYFADGIVDDLITALSRFKNLAVISRNSSFAYRGKAMDVRQSGRALAAHGQRARRSHWFPTRTWGIL